MKFKKLVFVIVIILSLICQVTSNIEELKKFVQTNANKLKALLKKKTKSMKKHVSTPKQNQNNNEKKPVTVHEENTAEEKLRELRAHEENTTDEKLRAEKENKFMEALRPEEALRENKFMEALRAEEALREVKTRELLNGLNNMILFEVCILETNNFLLNKIHFYYRIFDKSAINQNQMGNKQQNELPEKKKSIQKKIKTF